MKLNAYRYLSALLIIDTILVIVSFLLNMLPITLAGIVLAIIMEGVRSQMFKCGNCGCRPGLWILAIWNLLFNRKSYIADGLSLGRCPKCGKNLVEELDKSRLSES